MEDSLDDLVKKKIEQAVIEERGRVCAALGDAIKSTLEEFPNGAGVLFYLQERFFQALTCIDWGGPDDARQAGSEWARRTDSATLAKLDKHRENLFRYGAIEFKIPMLIESEEDFETQEEIVAALAEKLQYEGMVSEVFEGGNPTGIILSFWDDALKGAKLWNALHLMLPEDFNSYPLWGYYLKAWLEGVLEVVDGSKGSQATG